MEIPNDIPMGMRRAMARGRSMSVYLHTTRGYDILEVFVERSEDDYLVDYEHAHGAEPRAIPHSVPDVGMAECRPAADTAPDWSEWAQQWLTEWGLKVPEGWSLENEAFIFTVTTPTEEMKKVLAPLHNELVRVRERIDRRHRLAVKRGHVAHLVAEAERGYHLKYPHCGHRDKLQCADSENSLRGLAQSVFGCQSSVGEDWRQEIRRILAGDVHTEKPEGWNHDR